MFQIFMKNKNGYIKNYYDVELVKYFTKDKSAWCDQYYFEIFPLLGM